MKSFVYCSTNQNTRPMAKRKFSELSAEDLKFVERAHQSGLHISPYPKIVMTRSGVDAVFNAAAVLALDIRKDAPVLRYAMTPQGVMVCRVDELSQSAKTSKLQTGASFRAWRSTNTYFRASQAPLRRAGLEKGAHYYLDGPHHIDGVDWFGIVPEDEYLDPDNGYIDAEGNIVQ